MRFAHELELRRRPMPDASEGFSLVEALAAIVAIGIIASIGIMAIRGQMVALGNNKLHADVKNLNAAVRVFEASGGNFDPVSDPRAIIERLKTAAASAQYDRLVGLRGKMVDPGLKVVMQTPNEAASDQPRVRWDMGKRRFVIYRDGAAGVKKFVVDDALASVDTEEVERRMALQYSDESSSWVWNYVDRDVGVTEAPRDLTANSFRPLARAAPPGLTMRRLRSPRFTVRPGNHPLAAYPLSVGLTDPNPPGIAQLLYAIDGGGWNVYAGTPFEVEPDSVVTATSLSVDPDRWRDAEPVYGDYKAIPVVPQLALNFTGPAVDYVAVGGAMIGVGQSPGPPGVISLLNGSDIPAAYQNDSVFTVHWTYDGSDPLTSTTREDGAPFANGFPGQDVGYPLARWSGATLPVKIAAESQNPGIVSDSPVVTSELAIARLPLRPPVIADFYIGPAGVVTMSLETTFGDMPQGARIFYKTDGTDPGIDSEGNPLSGTEYTGPATLAISPSTGIAARVYGPSGHARWFVPSLLTIATPSPPTIGFTMGVAIDTP